MTALEACVDVAIPNSLVVSNFSTSLLMVSAKLPQEISNCSESGILQPCASQQKLILTGLSVEELYSY